MAGKSDAVLFHELCFYTLAHGDQRFIHQHVVDAWAAQHASHDSKPIATAFALIGLCLHLEEGYSGRQVQDAHMKLARRRKQWPRFEPPANCGEITIRHVLAAPPGPQRDEAIEQWCRSVWQAWSASHAETRALIESELWRR